MAIQVNGTQVIGNSRELTNITSIDATTATAFGNAGVGGVGYTLVSSTTYTAATYSFIDVTIPTTGYFEITISGSFPLPSTNWHGVYVEYLNSSNTQLIAPSVIPVIYGGAVFGAYAAGAPQEYLKPLIIITGNNSTNVDTSVSYSGTYKSTSYTGAPAFPIDNLGVTTTGQIAKMRLTTTAPSLKGHASFYNISVVGLG